MIENETQYRVASQERLQALDALSDAMQFGRPSHVDPVLWGISTKVAVSHVIRLETLMREYLDSSVK
jgi:hypothetical protein